MSLGEITIGIVIPNKNDSKYLGECIDSVLNQSSLPDEIIYIDDVSSDDSIKKAESYLSQIPFSTIIKNKTSYGTMNALNQGLMSSKSDYLLFLASNDKLTPGIIAEVRKNFSDLAVNPGVWSALVNFLNEDGKVMRIHYSPLVSTKVKYFTNKECITLANKLGNWFTGTTTYYRREALIQIGGFDARLGGLGDLFAALQLASNHGAIYCPKPYGYMRIHGEGLLVRTLKNSAQIDNMLCAIFELGVKNAPELFEKEFILKTIQRIKFASLREMIKDGKLDIPTKWSGLIYDLFKILMKKGNKSLLLFFAYILMRPFDLTWLIYYRTKAIAFDKWRCFR